MVDVLVLVEVLVLVLVVEVLVVLVVVVVGGGGAIYPTKPHHAGTSLPPPPVGVHCRSMYELFAIVSSNAPEFPVLLTPRTIAMTLLLDSPSLRLNVYPLGVPGDRLNSM